MDNIRKRMMECKHKTGTVLCCKTKRSIGCLILMVAVVVSIVLFVIIADTALSRAPVGQTDLLLVRPSPLNLNHLVDIHQFAGRQNTKGEGVIAKRRPGREAHSILWYNKPDAITWKDVDGDCEYNNCKMTEDRADLSSHSAIVFTLTEGMGLNPTLPRTSARKDQVWVLYYYEPPQHLYVHTIKLLLLEKWIHGFNWTMSYRLDSDIPLPYGTLSSRRNYAKRDYSQIYQRKRKIAAWAVSYCGANSCRDEYVNELRKHGVQVDIFGSCGSNKNMTSKSQLSRMLNTDYKFYFAFENNFCRDYITEKFFYYYNLDIVLVARGGADYDRLLPKGGFIDSSKFQSPKVLAEYLLKVSASEILYTNYLRTKNLYQGFGKEKVLHEYSFCKLCEKLNNKHDNVKVYDNILNVIHQENMCAAPTDVKCRIYTMAVIVLVICYCIFIFIIVFLFNKYLAKKIF